MTWWSPACICAGVVKLVEGIVAAPDIATVPASVGADAPGVDVLGAKLLGVTGEIDPESVLVGTDAQAAETIVHAMAVLQTRAPWCARPRRCSSRAPAREVPDVATLPR